MGRTALISVSDRTGLEQFAKALRELDFTLLATSGTTKFLKEVGVETVPIEEYTGQREILDGRVKTLHPKIHGGLLAKRDNDTHLQQLKEEGIRPIEIAVVNLYPFVQNLSSEAANSPEKMTELFDIGGPTMIRAAAKNHRYVLPVIDPADYPRVIEALKSGDVLGPAKERLAGATLRLELARKVFTTMARYDLEISKYLSQVSVTQGDEGVVRSADLSHGLMFGDTSGLVLSRAQALRYGENPHQRAALYREVGSTDLGWSQLHGKELSYNNLLDFDAALRLVRALETKTPVAVIIKHLNPCGVANGNTLLEALVRAKRSDPRSHFGGILAFNRPVSADVAQEIRGDFAEIVLAPEFQTDALEILKGNKNLRVVQFSSPATGVDRWEMRKIEGGLLIQEEDRGISNAEAAKVVSRRAPTQSELQDLDFAWRICAHVKSNAIVIVKDGMLIGVGAGQMSRIDSVEVALFKAKTHGHDLHGAVAASDAFFPFPDSVETLANQGIRAVIAPEGAKRDQDAISAADSMNIALLFTPERHFRH